MDDINNAIALGVQTPKAPDVIGQITSLAQLQYLAQRGQYLGAQAQVAGANAQFNQGKLAALNQYGQLRGGGLSAGAALDQSGLGAYDPSGASAILNNQGTALTLQGRQAYAANPSSPLAAAAMGPEAVSTAATAGKTAADTNAKLLQQKGQIASELIGGVASDGTIPPAVRSDAIGKAMQLGLITQQQAQYAMAAPDQSLLQIAKGWQMGGMTPTEASAASGATAANQAAAEANFKPIMTQPGQGVTLPPGLSSVVYPGRGAQPGAAGAGLPAVASPQSPLPAMAQRGAPAAMPSGPNAGVPQPLAASPVSAAGASTGPNYYTATMNRESGGNPSVINSTTGAGGLYQFLPSTAATVRAAHPELGLSQNWQLDPKQAPIGMQAFTADNAKILANAGVAVNDKNLTMAHFLGAGGASKFIQAGSQNPDASAASLFPAAAKANPTIFYANGSQPRTLSQVYAVMTKGFGNGLTANGTAPSQGVQMAAGAPLAQPGGSVPPGFVEPGLPLSPLQQAANIPVPPGLGAPTAAKNGVAPIVPSATNLQPSPAPASGTPPNAAGAQSSQPLAPGVTAPRTGLAADQTAPLIPPSGPVTLQPALTLAQKVEQEGQGKGYGELPAKLDAAADSAKDVNNTLEQMEDAQNGSWQPGKWAPVAENLRESLQSVAKGLGVDTPGLDQSISSYQDFAKLSGNILREAAHETSSRVGVQEMELISKSLPSPEMSGGGFQTISPQLKGVNDYKIAEQQAASAWRTQNGQSLGPNKTGVDFQTDWNNNASPAAFVAHRLQAQNPQVFDQMISTMAKQPGGKTALGNLLNQMQWAQQKGPSLMADAGVQLVDPAQDDSSGDIYVQARPQTPAPSPAAIGALRSAMQGSPQGSQAPAVAVAPVAPPSDASVAMDKIKAALASAPTTNDNSAATPAQAAMDKIKATLAGNPPASQAAPPQPRGATIGSVTGEIGSGLSKGAIDAVGLPVDLTAGAMNLGIRGVNALTGASIPTIDHPFGGSQSIADAFGAVDPRMNPANNPPQNPAERIAEGLGAGAGGAMVLPGVAGAIRAGGLAGPAMQAVQTAAGPLSVGNTLTNAAAGAGGEAAASAVPDRYKPLAQLTGSLAAGGVAAPLTEAPTLANASVKAAHNFAAPMTESGQQQLAADMFAKGVADRNAASAALDSGAPQGVPGSNLTTAQATGDIGIGSMERAAETASPVPFNARRAEQGAARVATIKGLQPTGDPAAVSKYLRDQMAGIDALGSAVEGAAAQKARATEAASEAATRGADAAATERAATPASGIGTAAGGTPEGQGAAMRGALSNAKDAAKAHERALWKAVDPDNTLALSAHPVKDAAQRLEGGMATTAKPIGGEERAILDTIGAMPAVAKFNEITALRSRISSAMKEELRSAGETPVYARLSQLRGAVESAISSAVEHKVAQESAAVSSGAMAPEQTMGYALARSAQQFQSERRLAGTRLTQGDGDIGSVRAAPVSSTTRGAGEGDRQSGGNAGDQSLPLATNFDQAAADRLKAASDATKARAQTFGQGAVGDTLATRGQQGNFRILDSAVGAKFFKPGATGADAVKAYRGAVANDPEALRALEGFAGLSLRKAALNPANGTIDPAKFQAWQKAHADALRAMPEVAAKFGVAVKASEDRARAVAETAGSGAVSTAMAEDAVANATADKAHALDAFQEGAVGKILGLTDAADVTKTIGGIFGQKDAIGAMRKLAQTVKANPDARDGLRKGVADFLASKAISNTDDVKADTFQTFVRQNRPVLGQVFSAEEMKGIESVAAELSHVNRIAKQAALPARSNTAMDLLAQKSKEAGAHLSPLAEMMIGGSAGLEAAGIKGAVVGAGAAATKALAMSARAAGMENVKDLMRGMLLHPELAKAALERASTSSDASASVGAIAAIRRLQAQFGRIATLTANRMVSPQ